MLKYGHCEQIGATYCIEYGFNNECPKMVSLGWLQIDARLSARTPYYVLPVLL